MSHGLANKINTINMHCIIIQSDTQTKWYLKIGWFWNHKVMQLSFSCQICVMDSSDFGYGRFHCQCQGYQDGNSNLKMKTEQPTV